MYNLKKCRNIQIRKVKAANISTLFERIVCKINSDTQPVIMWSKIMRRGNNKNGECNCLKFGALPS